MNSELHRKAYRKRKKKKVRDVGGRGVVLNLFLSNW